MSIFIVRIEERTHPFHSKGAAPAFTHVPVKISLPRFLSSTIAMSVIESKQQSKVQVGANLRESA